MAELKMIPVKDLKPRDDNLRVDVDLDDGFVQSIRQNGVLTALTVVAENGHYLIDAGHRRLAGAKKAGLTEVPCYVYEPSFDGQHNVTMLVENVQRQGLNPIEQAKGMARLIEAGWKQAEIAEYTGLSKAVVSRRLALLDLPTEAQAALVEGKVDLDEAEALVKLARLNPELAVEYIGHSLFAIARAIETLTNEQAREKIEAKIVNAGYAVVKVGEKGVVNEVPVFVDYVYDDDGGVMAVEAKPLDLERASKIEGFAGFSVTRDGDKIYVTKWSESKTTSSSSATSSGPNEEAKQRRLAKQQRLHHAQEVAAGRLARQDIVKASLTYVLQSIQHGDKKTAAQILQLDPVERPVTRYLNDGSTKEGVEKDYAAAWDAALAEADPSSSAIMNRFLAAVLLVPFVEYENQSEWVASTSFDEASQS